MDPRDPRMVEALTWLVGDDPARVSQDAEIITRWRYQQGLPADTGNVRQRVTARIDTMARRQQACALSLPPAQE